VDNRSVHEPNVPMDVGPKLPERRYSALREDQAVVSGLEAPCVSRHNF
jgi:hypothetical protein